MKICPTCGAQLNDDAVFCAACGNAVPAAVEAAPQIDGFAPAAAQPSGGNKKALIAIVAVAAVAAVVLVIVLFSTLFSSPKSTVKAYFRAMNSRNASKIVKLEYPKPILEELEDEDDRDKDDLIDSIEDGFETKDELYGDDWKYKDIKITKVKDMKDDDFEDLQEICEDEYDMKITDAKIVKVDYTIEGDDDENEVEDREFIVIKYKGKWYIG